MSDYTADRLELLESETHGALALDSQTTMNGWTVTTLPSGECIAELQLDMNSGTEFTWDYTNAYVYLGETLPSGLFATVTDCTLKVTDISDAVTNNNSIMAVARDFPSVTSTGEWFVCPYEYSKQISGFTLPTKIHTLWTVRGIKATTN